MQRSSISSHSFRIHLSGWKTVLFLHMSAECGVSARGRERRFSACRPEVGSWRVAVVQRANVEQRLSTLSGRSHGQADCTQTLKLVHANEAGPTLEPGPAHGTCFTTIPQVQLIAQIIFTDRLGVQRLAKVISDQFRNAGEQGVQHRGQGPMRSDRERRSLGSAFPVPSHSGRFDGRKPDARAPPATGLADAGRSANSGQRGPVHP